MSEEIKPKPGPKPSHIAYEVRDPDYDSREPIISRIGAVWPHKDGGGYDVMLSAHPANGRVMLRTVRDRLEEAKNDSRSDDRPAEKRRDDRGR